jgi:uncharacterized protein (TIGR03437 family)
MPFRTSSDWKPMMRLCFVLALGLTSHSVVRAQILQQGPKMVGSGAVGGADQGSSVAISADGNTVLIGGASDNNGMGAAWVFVRTNGAWLQQGDKLVGAGAVGAANQGRSVALSADGNTAAIGAPLDNSGLGAVWVYTRSGGVWTQQGSKLVGSGATPTACQGYSVSLSADGNTLAWGGYADSDAVGAAWVFTRSGNVWHQYGGKLVGNDAAGDAKAGASVALSGDGKTLIIGGPEDNGGIGAAWIFTPQGILWWQEGPKLVGTAAVGSSGQGSSVALSTDGNTALVGGPLDNRAGGGWVFVRSGYTWAQQGSKLIGDGAHAAWLGDAVGLSGDGTTAILGAWGENGGVGEVFLYTRFGAAWSLQGSPLSGTPSSGFPMQGATTAISTDGSTIIVGAPGDGRSRGAAWIFVKSGSGWTQQGAKLAGTGAAGGPGFQGAAVAISADGNTAIVGAPADNGGTGAAWIYARSSGIWAQQGQKLVGTGTVGDAGQGASVAISADGNTVLIGGSNDNGLIGAAWAFTRSGGTWTQQGSKLVGSNGGGMVFQGTSVALSADGNVAIVGGPGELNQLGAAWIFKRSGASWSQRAKLQGPDASLYAYQGTSVALSGDGGTALVGGPGDFAGGAAWLYKYVNGSWVQQGNKLTSGRANLTAMGYSVALSSDGNTMVLGAPGDNGFIYSAAIGGAVIFTQSGGNWIEEAKLGGIDVSPSGAGQGITVALSGDGNIAVIGGPYDSVGLGALWVFTRSAGAWVQQGAKLVGSGAVGSAGQGSAVAVSADGSTLVEGGMQDSGNIGAAWAFVIPASPAGPSIAPGGVVNAADFVPQIGPGTWVTVEGSNLSTSTRTWGPSDFSGSNLPTQLDGVSVTVDGKPAYIYYISPSQLNILTPDDTLQGPVAVQVTTAHGKSNVVSASETSLAPALFTFSPQGSKYAAAVRADGTYIGPPNLFAGQTTVPAKPGDVILLYGTGFGGTNPASPVGQISAPSPLAVQPAVYIGGTLANTLFAGLVSPGLCQFNVVVPDVPDGDRSVLVQAGGVSSAPGTFLSIKQ